jgi:hypothetical protein
MLPVDLARSLACPLPSDLRVALASVVAMLAAGLFGNPFGDGIPDRGSCSPAVPGMQRGQIAVVCFVTLAVGPRVVRRPPKELRRPENAVEPRPSSSKLDDGLGEIVCRSSEFYGI